MRQVDTQTQMNMVKTHRDPMMEKLMKKVKVMQAQIEGISTQTINKQKVSTINKTSERTNNNDHTLSSTEAINPKTGKQWRRYFWSCGCCPHWGKHCPEKKLGHHDDATFRNLMNGNNQNCL